MRENRINQESNLPQKKRSTERVTKKLYCSQIKIQTIIFLKKLQNDSKSQKIKESVSHSFKMSIQICILYLQWMYSSIRH